MFHAFQYGTPCAPGNEDFSHGERGTGRAVAPAMLDLQQTIASLVLDHPECAEVFQRHQIDFCCNGRRSLADACADEAVGVDTLVAELEAAIAARTERPQIDPRTRSTPSLVAEIVSTHHEYLRRALPFVRGLAEKVSRVHGEHNPRLRDLDVAVRELDDALGPHLDEEEQVLFPALTNRSPDRALLARQLEAMHGDHLTVGKLVARIREATEGYRVPEWGCGSYRALFAELRAMEDDILRHVHLENHVLAPRFAEV